jgi:hypothetical protein
VGDRHADPGDQDATTEEISVELTPEGVWIQRSTSPDKCNCVFLPARTSTGCSIANRSA